MSRNPDEILTKSSDVLLVDNHIFDQDRKELRTADGVLVPLRAQAGEILGVLAKRPNVIVGKQELIENVWCDTNVTDDSLVQCIVDIRRALGERAREVIETFPKRGYRLNVMSPENAGTEALTRPSIAVLPFVDLSGDPDQEFFADGMTEDVITGLSRFHSLQVAARSSSFEYIKPPHDVREIAQFLGVRYILEGSVRRVAERVRIAGKLLDATANTYLWADHFDREIADIFDIQDEITDKIVASIAPEIDFSERQRARRKPPDSLDVWGLYQRGLAMHESAMGDDCKSVVEQFDKVCELDPTFAPGFAMAASSRVRYALLFEPDNRAGLLEQALDKARTGISLDARDSICLWAHGRVLSLLGRHDAAVASSECAVSLNPNDSMAHYYLAIALGSAGQLEDAISELDSALALSPHDVLGGGFRTYKSFVLFDLERYAEALECAQRAIREAYPLSIPFEIAAAALFRLQRPKEAKIAIRDLLNHTPDISLTRLRNRPWIGRPEAKGRYFDALSAAGMPG